MYIGHYAAAIGFTALRPRPRLLSYLALSSSLPDLLMLGTANLGSHWNYHADLGLLLCCIVVLVVGALLRFDRWSIVLAVGGLASHLLLDVPYVARDQSNLYAHPSADFLLEGALLAGAGAFYLHRTQPRPRRRALFVLVLAALGILQGVWDAKASSFPT